MISLAQNLSWIIPVAVGSFVALVSFTAICAYCFKKKSDDDDDQDAAEEERFTEKISVKKRPSDPLYMQLPKYTERSLSLPGTPSKTPLDEPGWGSRSVQYGALTPSATPPLREFSVQPPNKEIKGILKSKYSNGNDVASPSRKEIPTEPEPPLPTEQGEDLGTLYFSISYNATNLVLKLTIQKATGLPAKDISGTSDPFVKVLLLPDKKHKLETRVKRKNLNPTWNEAFTFEGFPFQKLTNRSIYMQVLDYDRFSRNDPIGEIEISLADLHLQEEPVSFVKKLLPCKRSPVSNNR